jgi:transposase
MDMLRFSSADKLSSYIGVVPSVAGSGEKDRVKGFSILINRGCLESYKK